MKTLIVVLVIAIGIAVLVSQQSEINRKCESRKRYSDLYEFYHFIGTCKKTDENRNYIADRLKSERSLHKEEKALHLVQMCEEIFNARFKV